MFELFKLIVILLPSITIPVEPPGGGLGPGVVLSPFGSVGDPQDVTVIPKAAKSAADHAVLRKSFLEYAGISFFDFVDKPC